jgi:hypothetical protein
MALWHKPSNPIDRCLDDVNGQIAAVERQVRELSIEKAARPAAQPPPSDAMTRFVKEMLKPAGDQLGPRCRRRSLRKASQTCSRTPARRQLRQVSPRNP